MKALLILRHIRVENANAISGAIYGFPSISAFLGFSHALSRATQKELGLSLGGCAVVCHDHQVHAYQPGGWGDYVFSLTRNPLTKEAKTPAFVEEGRMNMDVSLMIECEFTGDEIGIQDLSEEEGVEHLERFLLNQALTQRLAGGTITGIGAAQFEELEEDRGRRLQQERKLLYRLLPGSALVDRSELAQEHHQHRVAEAPESEYIDSWLDFSALKRRAVPELAGDEVPTEAHSADWQYQPKPSSGWLCPIAVGYRAISPLYENGEVSRTRDEETPFRFVELAYGLGQWISPHRVKSVGDLIWHYRAEGDWYLCQNGL